MPLILRTPPWHRLVAIGAPAVLAPVLMASAASVGFSSIAEAALTLLMAASAIVSAAVAMRASRLRVEIDDRQVTIVNWLGVKRCELVDVRYFSAEVGFEAVMRDDSSIAADVFGPWFLPPSLRDEAASAVRICQSTLRGRRARVDE